MPKITNFMMFRMHEIIILLPLINLLPQTWNDSEGINEGIH